VCSQSTSESWAQFNHDNVTRAEHERMASIQMRTLSNNILHDTARDIREQCDASDNAFERRVREMEDCKSKLMENLKKVCIALRRAGFSWWEAWGPWWEAWTQWRIWDFRKGLAIELQGFKN